MRPDTKATLGPIAVALLALGGISLVYQSATSDEIREFLHEHPEGITKDDHGRWVAVHGRPR